MTIVNQLRKRLVDLNAALPDKLKDTDQNIHRHFNTPVWTPFVMFHTWYYCLHSDLHRFALPDMRESATAETLRLLREDFLSKCRAQAVAYSISQARFWQTLRRKVAHRGAGIENMIVLDVMALPCLIQVIKILLVARKHGFWVNVEKNSPAPLRNDSKPIDGPEIQELLECTLQCLQDFLLIKPDITALVRVRRRVGMKRLQG
jgi:hypothetical protein